MTAATGSETIDGVTFEFEENGKLVSGVWVETAEGTKYCYGPGYYQDGWQEIDGNAYHFVGGYRRTGINYVRTFGNVKVWRWYDFGEDGIARDVEDGLHRAADGELYCIIDNIHLMGLNKVEGDYYFFCWDGHAVAGQEYYAWETHCDLPCDTYMFGEDAKMVRDGVIQREDGYYHYVQGKISKVPGLMKIGDDYYFVSSIGRVATGVYYCWATSCELPVGNYEFAEDGKMLRGIVQKADGPYCYTYGNLNKTEGLTKVGEDYCYVTSSGKCVTGTYYARKTNCDLPVGTYEFGDDGRMLNGIVEKDDGLYLYNNGTPKPEGMTKIGNDYFYVTSTGKLATGIVKVEKSNCDLPVGTYEFGADGKMIRKIEESEEPDVPTVKNGLVQEANGIYYYINGEYGPAGITKIGGYYYFVSSIGRVATGSYYCWATNCEIPCGTYEFDSQGRMLNPPVDTTVKNGLVQEADGIYYYVNGKYGPAGITKIGNDYYFVSSIGRVATGSYYCWATNCELPCGTYEFDADGKMIS